MKRPRRGGIAPRASYATPVALQRKKWAEMSRTERMAWIEETCIWLADKRRREQTYLDRRHSDLKTDRDYRADAIREMDMLAMLSELEEAEREEKLHE